MGQEWSTGFQGSAFGNKSLSFTALPHFFTPCLKLNFTAANNMLVPLSA